MLNMKLKKKLAKSARKGANLFTKEMARDPDPTELDEGMPSGGDSNLAWAICRCSSADAPVDSCRW